jgi:hypothetical protein
MFGVERNWDTSLALEFMQPDSTDCDEGAEWHRVVQSLGNGRVTGPWVTGRG